jgi:hypothetical protein
MAISVEDLIDSRLELVTMYNAVPFWSCTNSKHDLHPDGKGSQYFSTVGESYPVVETFGRGVGTACATSYCH